MLEWKDHITYYNRGASHQCITREPSSALLDKPNLTVGIVLSLRVVAGVLLLEVGGNAFPSRLGLAIDQLNPFSCDR